MSLRLCLSFTLLLAIAGAVPRSAAAQTPTDWKQRWEATLAQAKQEGSVTVWGPGGSAMQRAAMGFEKAFPGITVEYSGSRGPAQAAKLRAEREGGLYTVDVFIQGPTTANFILKPAGLLDPLPPLLMLPEVTDRAQWLNGEIDYSDRERQYNLVYLTEVSPELIYNPRLAAKQEVDSLAKLLDAKWRGKILINDPSVTGAGVPWFRALWVGLGPEKASSFYRGIQAQQGPVTRDTGQQVEWVAQGKAAILLAPSSSSFQQLAKRGLKFEILSELAEIPQMIGSSSGTVSLINRAPHPAAAAVYVNWMLTRPGQELLQEALGMPSRRLDVPKTGIPDYQIPQPGIRYWPSYTEDNQRLEPPEQSLITELFGR